MPEQIFLESMARVADTQGKIWCTGSLGIQYTNPKNHWIYRHFIEKPLADSEVFTWPTLENPYFPKAELERLKDTLDARTYQALFNLNWDIQPANRVYEEFSEENLKEGSYDPNLETYVSVDWGWTHRAVCLFIQYDPKLDCVYVIDEIAESKLLLDQFFEKIKKRPYNIKDYFCDISGKQEQAQTGLSNIAWFRNNGIFFRYRKVGIAHSVALVRSYVKNMQGVRRLFINPKKCPKLVDGMTNYAYDLKNGEIDSELPLKKEDDEVDALRYFFANRLDFTRPKDSFVEFDRWKALA